MTKILIFLSLLFLLLLIPCASAFSDNFNRADNNTVGNGWIETESATAKDDININTNTLRFNETNAVNANLWITTPYFISPELNLQNITYLININSTSVFNLFRMGLKNETHYLINLYLQFGSPHSLYYRNLTQNNVFIRSVTTDVYHSFDIYNINFTSATFSLKYDSSIYNNLQFNYNISENLYNFIFYSSGQVARLRIDNFNLTILGNQTCYTDFSCINFTECLQNNSIQCLNITDLNNCSLAYNDSLRDFDLNCSYCWENWSCTAYKNCSEWGFLECISVNDTNVCNRTYIGDYDEFKQNCTFFGTVNYKNVFYFCALLLFYLAFSFMLLSVNDISFPYPLIYGFFSMFFIIWIIGISDLPNFLGIIFTVLSMMVIIKTLYRF